MKEFYILTIISIALLFSSALENGISDEANSLTVNGTAKSIVLLIPKVLSISSLVGLFSLLLVFRVFR